MTYNARSLIFSVCAALRSRCASFRNRIVIIHVSSLSGRGLDYSVTGDIYDFILQYRCQLLHENAFDYLLFLTDILLISEVNLLTSQVNEYIIEVSLYSKITIFLL